MKDMIRNIRNVIRRFFRGRGYKDLLSNMLAYCAGSMVGHFFIHHFGPFMGTILGIFAGAILGLLIGVLVYDVLEDI